MDALAKESKVAMPARVDRLGYKGESSFRCKTQQDTLPPIFACAPRYSLHTHAEMLSITNEILDMSPQVNGFIVEAGCFKGGSTTKLSILEKLTNRKRVVFDSFAGLPDPGDDRRDFYTGEYAATLDEVRDNVKQYGELNACEFRKGLFSNTMPLFTEPIVAFIDVDLSSSVRT